MGQKTLVVLTPAFPESGSESNWVITQQLFTRTLSAHFPSLKIVILSLYYPYRTSGYEWQGMEVFTFNGTKRRKLLRVFFWDSVWGRLKKIRRENDVIGLFSFWCGECALIGHYFGKRHSIPHHCWLCGQDARQTNKMVKSIRPRPEELIAMSDFLGNEFYTNHGIRPRYTIPNGINPASFPPGRGTPGTSGISGERDIDILGVGSLSRLKRYDLFVDIVKSLQSAIPPIKAMLCGEGEGRENIEGLIREHGLEAHFRLLGETPNKEVLALMQRTKVLLHTSEYEGFGLVCLEALYAGAHVISFSHPMEADMPHWHNVRTREEMEEKARELLLSPDTVYEPVLVYTMENTVRAIMQLYEMQ
jgi:glycosyltransferase involved in cell wall biosynthesis